MLHVEIVDDDCASDEAHIHRFPLDTDLSEIVRAIKLLYPTANSIWIKVEEEET